MRILAAAVISGVLVSQSALSQTAVADDEATIAEPVTVDREQAADLAEELKAQAYSTSVDVQSEADAKMQAYADQIGSVATLLEAELRAGKQRTETEALYRELRRLRLEAIGLAMSGKAQLPEGAAEFDALLGELGRYQRNESPGAAAEPTQDAQP